MKREGVQLAILSYLGEKGEAFTHFSFSFFFLEPLLGTDKRSCSPFSGALLYSHTFGSRPGKPPFSAAPSEKLVGKEHVEVTQGQLHNSYYEAFFFPAISKVITLRINNSETVCVTDYLSDLSLKP